MRLRVGLAAAALMVLASCSNSPAVQRAGGTTMVAEATEPRSVGLMAFDGVLNRSKNGCLVLDTGDTPVLLRFPFGSRLADDGQSVDVPGQGVARIGDSINAGGQTGDPAKMQGIPAECQGLTSMLLWQ